MGIDNRDYGRYNSYGQQPGFHLSAPQSMTMKIIVFTGCIYLAQMMFGQAGWVNQHLSLDPIWYKKPWLFFQLLSYGFLHSLEATQHILFNMYGLWLFGRDIESRYGRREFLSFYLTAIVIAGLVWSLSTIVSGDSTRPLIGASGGTVAIMVLFALNFPHRKLLLMFLFPIPMWVLGCFIVISDAYGALGYSDVSDVAFTAHLGGTLFALLYYKFGWRVSNWIPSNFAMPSFKSRSKLRIHAPETSEADSEQQSKTDKEVDRILQKINAQGQDSLTRSERRFLEKASKEYQRKRQ